MNEHDSGDAGALWMNAMRDVGGATDNDIRQAAAMADNMPEDETRNELTMAQMRAALRQADATYRLWQRLFTWAGVDGSGSSVIGTLLRTAQNEFDDGECMAVTLVAHDLNALCDYLDKFDVQRSLQTPLTSAQAMRELTVLAKVTAVVPPDSIVDSTPAHVRDDHPALWSRLTAGLAEAWGVAAAEQWHAATKGLVNANDEMLRHFNQRAEGGYPATSLEVQMVSDLIGMDVTRGGDGFVTVDAGADPWRDSRGKIIHPLGVDR